MLSISKIYSPPPANILKCQDHSFLILSDFSILDVCHSKLFCQVNKINVDTKLQFLWMSYHSKFFSLSLFLQRNYHTYRRWNGTSKWNSSNNLYTSTIPNEANAAVNRWFSNEFRLHWKGISFLQVIDSYLLQWNEKLSNFF